MPAYKNIRCTIHTKDGPLQEYEDNDKSLSFPTKSVYIEAKSSTAFYFVCELLEGYHHIPECGVAFKIHVDGEKMNTKGLATKEHNRIIYSGSRIVECDKEVFIQPFEFTEILLAEDNDLNGKISPTLLSSIGEISVYAIRKIKKKRIEESRFSPPVRSFVGKLTEEDVKGKDITHAIKLGTKTLFDVSNLHIWECEDIDTIKEPYAHFRFRYRSKQALQNLGLIPKTPPPSPPLRVVEKEAQEMPLGVIQISSDAVIQEIARLQAQLSALKKQVNGPKIKREIKEEEDEAGGPELKRKKSSKRRWRTVDKTIDLTLED